MKALIVIGLYLLGAVVYYIWNVVEHQILELTKTDPDVNWMPKTAIIIILGAGCLLWPIGTLSDIYHMLIPNKQVK